MLNVINICQNKKEDFVKTVKRCGIFVMGLLKIVWEKENWNVIKTNHALEYKLMMGKYLSLIVVFDI